MSLDDSHLSETIPLPPEAEPTSIRAFRAPDSAHVGSVRLAVSDLKRSVAFYHKVIGLALHANSKGDPWPTARLGVSNGPVLLTLEQRPGVRPLLSRSRLGLYHTAFLLPNRPALANFANHLKRYSIPFGSSDHLVSEALYLTDPDGLEVEVYADRDRSSWTYEDGKLLMAIDPLRFDSLAAVATETWQGVPAEMSVGHMHFYIGDLEQGLRFYRDGLGLDITSDYPRARFLSAGGYHHHVGINTWIAGSRTAAEEDARLLEWEFVLPARNDVQAMSNNLRSLLFFAEPDESRFTDPWGLTVNLTMG